MASTVSVTLVNSQSDDPITNLTVPEGTTIQEFLDLNRVNTAKMTVTVRLNGDTIDYDLDDEVENGMRITVVPQNVKNAA